MTPLLETLRTLVGERHVLTEAQAVAGYATDWKRSRVGRPLAVVRPGTTEEVAQVVRAAVQAGVAIVPQGGNTGLALGATPDTSGGQLVLSLDRMRAIREVDPLGMTVEVEAGAVLQAVKDRARECGRDLPISFAAEGSASIGGIVSTNAGGVNVLRHGMTRDHVLGLEVVLSDGTIVDGLRRLRKDNAGPDWKQIFIGTEGALGIVTAATLRLSPPRGQRVVALLVPRNLNAALEVFSRTIGRMGDTLTAFEMISAQSLHLVARHAAMTPPVEVRDWALLVEAASPLDGLQDASMALLEALFEDGTILDGVVAESEAQADGLWALRERITESEAAEGPSLKHDVSVPIRAIPAVIDQIREKLATVAPAVTLNVFGHLGDGNLHVNVLTVEGTDADAVNRAVHDIVVAAAGSISAEHGLGAYRLDEWIRLAPAAEIALARRVKAAFDPRNLFNPGKAMPAPEEG